MNADEILKRDAELRAVACDFDKLPPDVGDARRYLANIAAAERALIEAVGKWTAMRDKGGLMVSNVAALGNAVSDAYRALLAAMESAQQ